MKNLPDLSKSFLKMKILDDLQEWALYNPKNLIALSIEWGIANNFPRILTELYDQIKISRAFMIELMGIDLIKNIEKYFTNE